MCDPPFNHHSKQSFSSSPKPYKIRKFKLTMNGEILYDWEEE